MAEERITETRDQNGNTHTTHTVVKDGTGKGGFGWAMLLLVAVLGIGGLVAFNQMGGAEIAKDNAVADAANTLEGAANN